MALCKKEQSRGVPLKMGFPDPDVVGVSTKAHFPALSRILWYNGRITSLTDVLEESKWMKD